MPEWVIATLSAFVALILREGYEWFRRPRIKTDFESWIGINPWLVDFSLGEKVMGIMDKSRCLRLRIHNAGKKPALDCEAKVEVYDKDGGDSAVQSLHWTRRDPRLYKTLDQIYAPIHLNPKDNELLDVLELNYRVDIDTNEVMNIPEDSCLETLSPYSIMLKRGKVYQLTITIYASNTVSKPFVFSVFWDGTLEGFDKAVSKGGKEKNV